MKWLLLLLTGCFGADYQVHQDTPFLLAATSAAVADWEAHVPVKISLADGPCPIPRTAGLICMHPIDHIPSMAWEPGILAGFTVYSEMWIAAPLANSMSEAEAQRLLAHEMGHAMGLVHTGPGTLMYPYPDGGALTVQLADVTQWMQIHKAGL